MTCTAKSAVTAPTIVQDSQAGVKSAPSPLVVPRSHDPLSFLPMNFVQTVGDQGDVIIDMYDFRCELSDKRTGELINARTFLSQASIRDRNQPASIRTIHANRTRKWTYDIRVSETLKVSVVADVYNLYVHGNPSRTHKVSNVFTDRSPQTQVSEYFAAILAAFQKMGRSSELDFRNDTLMRIDITQMLDCGSSQVATSTFAQLHMFLRAFGLNGVDREVHVHDNTIRVGSNNASNAVRMYRVSECDVPLVPRERDRWIRVELMLRRSELSSLVKREEWTPFDLNGVLWKYLRMLRLAARNYRPDRVNHAPVAFQDNALLELVWYAWQSGADLKRILGNDYNPVRRAFLGTDIDISTPPIPRRAREALNAALILEDLISPNRYDPRGDADPQLAAQLTELGAMNLSRHATTVRVQNQHHRANAIVRAAGVRPRPRRAPPLPPRPRVRVH